MKWIQHAGTPSAGHVSTTEEGSVMTDQTARPYESAAEAPSAAATGFILFAGILMVMSGAFQAFTGFVALFQDEFYLETRNYVLQLDATTWGWIHLIFGILLVAAGFSLMSGNMYGRIIGVIVAVLSAIANFAFLPYYPFWSLVIITLDVFVIWAITAHGGRLHE